MESQNGIIDPGSRSAGKAEPACGRFRIFFTGYRVNPPGSFVDGACAPAAHASAWNMPDAEDEKAYFQADISWINLAADKSPQTSVLTAMITGDVRGLRKRFPEDAADPAGISRAAKPLEWLPLSLGTYALVSKVNAISVGNPTIERAPRRLSGGDNRSLAGEAPLPGTVAEGSERKLPAAAGRACVVDLPLSKASRSKVIFLTYEAAGALAGMDQGFGRGVFSVACKDAYDANLNYTLYFGIDRL
jgi:hypothetical protein